MTKFIRTVQKKGFDVYNTTQWLHSAEHCVGNDNRFIFVITKRLFLFLLASLVLTLCLQPVFREKNCILDQILLFEPFFGQSWNG